MDQQPLFIIFIQLGLGGVERKIVDIVNFLKTYRPNLPIYILLRKHSAFSVQDQIINKQVTVITYTDWIKMKVPFFFIGFVLFHVWKLKPKAIVSFLDLPAYTALLAKILFFWRKINVVVGSDYYASQIVSTFNYPQLRHLLIKILYPYADKIFTCTQKTKNDLIKTYQISSQKIDILKNWTTYTTEAYTPTNRKFDCIYVGRLEKSKNVLFLLKTVQQMIKQNKNLIMAVVGDGKEKKVLQHYVEKNNLEKNVYFFGAQGDVRFFLNRAKLFMFAPKIKAEGFPIAIIEAMMLCVPVLTRYFEGADEVIQNGINGFITHSRKEFIQKAMWLLNHPKIRNQVALQAKKYVAKYHTPANMQAYFDELKI